MTKEELKQEAEEYFETECLHSYADTEEQLKEDVVPAFQKGAEFGYNKAKKEGKVVVEHFEAYGQCRDSRRIAGLEKENAELKEQLYKARQLLRSLCYVYQLGKNELATARVIAEAEQFVKEVKENEN